jgi:hypothetical protein
MWTRVPSCNGKIEDCSTAALLYVDPGAFMYGCVWMLHGELSAFMQWYGGRLCTALFGTWLAYVRTWVSSCNGKVDNFVRPGFGTWLANVWISVALCGRFCLTLRLLRNELGNSVAIYVGYPSSRQHR